MRAILISLLEKLRNGSCFLFAAMWEKCLSIPKFFNEVVIRDMDEDDIPAITAIYRHAVLNSAGTFETEPPGEAEMKIRWRVSLTSNYPFIVAERRDERRVMGFAYANAYRARAGYAKTVEDSVYVRDGFQGLGIGEMLLSNLIYQSAIRGFRQMIAVIGDAENIGAIRMHEKLDFVKAGVLRQVGRKHDRWLDTVLMQFELPQETGETEK
jgi:L-amino acid N-acyltransferase YncA